VNEPVEIERRHRFKARDIAARFHEQGGVCALCPAPLERFIADHRVPRAMGGKTNYANCQLLCLDCNALKTFGGGDISRIAKAKRQGAPRKIAKRPMKGRGFSTKLRRHLDGTTSER
jgi:5-methylcytosine-specific restriction endonuclease McrA